MVLEDFCLKLYFWPFLSILAGLKGICPIYPYGYFPFIPPPITDMTPTSPIPSVQPTPPTTLPPCPTDPLVCLPGGERPIEYCPCIDPRQQNGQATTVGMPMITESMGNNMNLESLLLRMAPNNPPTSSTHTQTMIFSSLDKSKRKRKRKKRLTDEERILSTERVSY